MRHQILKNRKRLVVKIGSSLLVNSAGQMEPKAFAALATQVSALVEKKYQVVLVSSGAIAMGLDQFALSKVPTQMHQKQALAAVGQIVLMQEYQKAFAKHDLKMGQIMI